MLHRQNCESQGAIFCRRTRRSGAPECNSHPGTGLACSWLGQRDFSLVHQIFEIRAPARTFTPRHGAHRSQSVHARTSADCPTHTPHPHPAPERSRRAGARARPAFRALPERARCGARRGSLASRPLPPRVFANFHRRPCAHTWFRFPWD